MIWIFHVDFNKFQENRSAEVSLSVQWRLIILTETTYITGSGKRRIIGLQTAMKKNDMSLTFMKCIIILFFIFTVKEKKLTRTAWFLFPAYSCIIAGLAHNVCFHHSAVLCVTFWWNWIETFCKSPESHERQWGLNDVARKTQSMESHFHKENWRFIMKNFRVTWDRSNLHQAQLSISPEYLQIDREICSALIYILWNLCYIEWRKTIKFISFSESWVSVVCIDRHKVILRRKIRNNISRNNSGRERKSKHNYKILRVLWVYIASCMAGKCCALLMILWCIHDDE